jgi:hypothetical protein
LIHSSPCPPSSYWFILLVLLLFSLCHFDQVKFRQLCDSPIVLHLLVSFFLTLTWVRQWNLRFRE